MALQRLALLLRTVRHLSPAQIASRVRLMVLRRWRRSSGRRFTPIRAEAREFTPVWIGLDDARRHPAATRHIENARRILEGHWSYLGIERHWPDEPAWRDATVPQLWSFHLHYFDFVLDLALARDYATFRRLVRSWLRANERLTGNGWLSYTVSLRAVNWMHALTAFRVELAADVSFHEQLTSAIAGHLRFLRGNLETDLGGNHLLENLRALIWGGVVFGERRWLDFAMRRLEHELAKQILSDGSHYERAPGYHLIVLRGLVEVRTLLGRNGGAPSWLAGATEQMLRFLREATGPEDRLPLFKDTVRSEDFPPSELLARGTLFATLTGVEPVLSEPVQNGTRLHAGGFFIVRDPRRFLIADFGRLGPDELPGHAHADMFSYELTVDGRPLIVDSGVHQYAGEWRNRFRATAAHNTVEVEGEDQSEMWGSFRVARRARPRNVGEVVIGPFRGVRGEHDGYARLKPAVIHRRTLLVSDEAVLVIDRLFGTGSARASSRVHFHPAIALKVGATIEAGPLDLVVFGDVTRAIEGGWYSERFGAKEATQVLRLDSEGRLPRTFGYCVALRGAAPAVSLLESGAVAVTTGGETLTIA